MLLHNGPLPQTHPSARRSVRQWFSIVVFSASSHHIFWTCFSNMFVCQITQLTLMETPPRRREDTLGGRLAQVSYLSIYFSISIYLSFYSMKFYLFDGDMMSNYRVMLELAQIIYLSICLLSIYLFILLQLALHFYDLCCQQF